MSFETKLQILKDNFQQTEGGITLREYLETTVSNDPGFYRWFFDTELEQDFDASLTDAQRQQFADFLASL